jgi:hypothetical protein
MYKKLPTKRTIQNKIVLWMPPQQYLASNSTSDIKAPSESVLYRVSSSKIITMISAVLCCFSLVSCTQQKDTDYWQADARALVMKSIDAHGGKDKWYNNGQLQFRWTYHMSDKGPKAIVDTIQTVDPKTLAVVHEVEGQDIQFGMNAGKAWILPAGTNFMPPARFWALTPYYFLAIPFVFNDPNANFEKLSETMEFEGKQYTQVRVTYNDTAGDSPDDFYVLLIDPKTKLTRGAYYSVTNKLVAPNGPGAIKFITLDSLINVDGVLLASGHRTFLIEDGKIGKPIRHTDVSRVKYLPVNTVDLSIPKNAGMK